MPEPKPADEDRLEEIVAYLDGELSPEESARVERRLASDESYRRSLQGIDRAWQALDELPLPAADGQFARTTMALTVEAAAADLQARTIAIPRQRRRSRLATTLVAAAAAALGLLVVRLATRSDERMLLVDLPVIDNVDAYSQVDGTEFLRSLQSALGPQLEELGPGSTDGAGQVERFQAVLAVADRPSWLGGLNAAERTDLRAKYNRFRELPAEEQQRLRALHGEIAAAPDAAPLQAAMFAYHEWLRGLPPARQFELRQMPPDERVRTVERWAGELRDDALFTLSDDELRHFVRKMREPLAELSRTAAKDMLAAPERRPNRFTGAMGPGLPGVLAVQFAAGVARPGKFQTALVEAIPERTREAFVNLPPPEKVERVMTWMRQAEAMRGEVSQEELERFFAEELDADTRAELLSLSPSDMQQALRRLYRRQPERGFVGPAAWGGRRGGEHRGGPREWDGRPRPDRRGPGEGPGFEGPGPGGPGPRGPGGPEGPGERGGPRPFGPPDPRHEFGPPPDAG